MFICRHRFPSMSLFFKYAIVIPLRAYFLFFCKPIVCVSAVPAPWLSFNHPEVSMSYALFIPDVNKPQKAVLWFDTGWRNSAALDLILSIKLSVTVLPKMSQIVYWEVWMSLQQNSLTSKWEVVNVWCIHSVPHNFVDRMTGTSICCAFKENSPASLNHNTTDCNWLTN